MDGYPQYVKRLEDALDAAKRLIEDGIQWRLTPGELPSIDSIDRSMVHALEEAVTMAECNPPGDARPVVKAKISNISSTGTIEDVRTLNRIATVRCPLCGHTWFNMSLRGWSALACRCGAELTRN
jgi:hypothetical protein